MGQELDRLLGFLLTRVILVGTVLVILWTLWNGLYTLAAGLLLAFAYFVYLTVRRVDVDDDLTDWP